MNIASVLTIAIALSFLGAAWLMHAQINTMKDFWFGKIQISVFLTKDVTEPQRDAIRQQLEALPQVDKIFYESKAEAYQRFKDQFKGTPSLVKNTDPAALPESFRVKLKDPRKFSIVASAVQDMPGVDQVGDAAAALKRFFHILDGIETVAIGVALIVLVAAILLIFNTVRIAAFSRRRETSIMRLVGASNLYIAAPFVLETMVQALVGSMIAGGALFLIKLVLIDNGVVGTLGQLIRIIGWSTVAWTVPVLVLLALALALVTSVGTLQRYLRV